MVNVIHCLYSSQGKLGDSLNSWSTTETECGAVVASDQGKGQWEEVFNGCLTAWLTKLPSGKTNFWRRTGLMAA